MVGNNVGNIRSEIVKGFEWQVQFGSSVSESRRGESHILRSFILC